MGCLRRLPDGLLTGQLLRSLPEVSFKSERRQGQMLQEMPLMDSLSWDYLYFCVIYGDTSVFQPFYNECLKEKNIALLKCLKLLKKIFVCLF